MAMADALLRPSPPSLSRPPALQTSPSAKQIALRFSANRSSNFSDVFLAGLGGESQRLWRSRRAGVCVVKRKVRCTRASVGEDRRDRKEPELLPPGELLYFGKLSAGCVAGAVVVKYSSLLVPSITRPNIDQALLMIGTPVAASVVLLTLASIVGSDWLRRKP